MSGPNELEDQLFRLRNIYSCREEGTGRALPFRLRDEQEMLAKHFIEQPLVPSYVVKSRRLGISTFVDTFMSDCAAFRQAFHGFLIDQKQEDASRKMIEIVRFAIDSLPPEILKDYVFPKRNDSELRMRMRTEEEKHDSVIYATVGGRGGDCSMLHVSEWGPIAAMDPDRSAEIRSGAFPAARKALRVVETTWYGGRAGDLFELIQPIIDGNPNAEGVLYFFPWHADPQAIKVTGELTKESEEYFRDLTGKLAGKAFSQEQKLWYTAKKLEQGKNMLREYPSTITEAMSTPVPGAIYADEMGELREEKRMIVFAPEATAPAYSFWDIGVSDYGCIWLLQFVGRDILFLDYHSNEGHGAAHYVKWLRDKEREHGVSVRTNYLPHDADQRSKGTAKTYRADVVEAGIPDAQIRVVPRTPDVWVGINRLRALLKKTFIHATNCNRELVSDAGNKLPSGVQCLDFYRKKVSQSTGGGGIFEDPVHDIYSNGCFVAGTAIECERGSVPIEEVRSGDRVRLGRGFGEVEWAGLVKMAKTLTIQLSNGAIIECSEEHKFFTIDGMVRADKLRPCAQLLTSHEPNISRLLNSPKGLREGFSEFIEAGGSIYGKSVDIMSPKLGTSRCSFTEKYGRTMLGRLVGVKPRLALADQGILKCWSAGESCTKSEPIGRTGSLAELFSISAPLNRITARHSTAESMAVSCSIASSGVIIEEELGLDGMCTTKTETRKITTSPILRRLVHQITASTTQKRTSGWGQTQTNDKSERTNEYLLSVVAVRPSGNFVPVYDLTVTKHHAYVANGVLVSNCDAIRTFAEADRQGMLEGSSGVAKEARNHPVQVIRNASAANSSRPRSGAGLRVLR